MPKVSESNASASSSTRKVIPLDSKKGFKTIPKTIDLLRRNDRVREKELRGKDVKGKAKAKDQEQDAAVPSKRFCRCWRPIHEV
jgi:hypothetical protein